MSPRDHLNNVKRAKGLIRQHNGGPAAHKEAVKRAQEAERIATRRAKMWRLFTTEELTFQQMGARLGVSNYTAHKDVMAVIAAMRANGLYDAEVMLARANANVRYVIRKHLPKADRVESARVILQALEREARLNGLDKTREGGYTAEQVIGLLKALASDLLAQFQSDEQRRAIADAFRKRMGEGAIDATPTPALEEKVG